MKKVFALMMVLLVAMFMVSCEEDTATNDDNSNQDPWIGKWLSTGTNVAPLLVYYFQYDSVRVEFKDDQSVILETHTAAGSWTTTSGVFSVTLSDEGTVHSIHLNYTAFEQDGIFEITEGNPDTFKLEAVQTTPSLGATPRTPETGFGSDTSLGTSNIQTYVRM